MGGSGAYNFHPGTSGTYDAPAGTHTGCLTGPDGTDFDLHLQKWNGSTWVTVAQGVSTGSDEHVSYTGTAGSYSWVVESWNGAGDYTFAFDRP